MKAEETHHPLKGSGEAGRLIGDDSPIRQPKFQWNRSIVFRRLFSIERAKDTSRLIVASQNNRDGLGCIGPELIEPVRMIEQGDVVTLLMEMVRSGEASQSSTENKDGV